MKIAFLDFEFGQIYGSWRRDFLITQAAVLIYDTSTEHLKLGEVICKSNFDLVMRETVKDKNNKTITIPTVINYHTNKQKQYLKRFKLKKNAIKKLRQRWNRNFFQKVKNFLKTTLQDVEIIYLFGGREDINLLKRLQLEFDNIIDIQKILQRTFNIQYSLDRVTSTLLLDNFILENQIVSINHSYHLPKQQHKVFQYIKENIISHNASGDCVRLFLVYKELIEY